MSIYKDMMNGIQPQSAPEELAARIAAGKVPERKRKARPLAAFAAGIAAAAALTVTVGAVSGFLNFGSIMQKDFNDTVSSDKFTSGVYQPLDVTAENDDISVTAEAFLGDTVKSFVVVQAKLKCDIPASAERLRLSVRMYCEGIDEEVIDNIYASQYYGRPQTDENGETVYVFRMKCVPFYMGVAAENDIKMVVDITDIAFTNIVGSVETSNIRKADLKLSFVPDRSVIKDAECISLDRETSLAGGDCVLRDFVTSEYVSRLTIDFNSDEISWSSGSLAAGRLLNMGESTSFNAESCPIKLVVDGEYIPYLYDSVWGDYLTRYDRDELNFAVNMFWYNEANDGSWMQGKRFGLHLNFEPFDYEAAESVYLELQTANGTETVVIK